MVTVTTQVVANNGQTIDIQVNVSAPHTMQGGGIQLVNVRSVINSILHMENPPLDPQGLCAESSTFSKTGIPLQAFPLYIEVWECQISVEQGSGVVPAVTTVGPLMKDVVGIPPCNAKGSNQNNSACILLQQKIQLLRNKILIECADASAVRGQRDAAATVAGAALVSWISLSVAAAVTPWPWWLFLAIAASVFLVVFIAASVIAASKQKDLDKISTDMSKDRNDLLDLVGRLSDVCCPEFITVPQDVPLCPN